MNFDFDQKEKLQEEEEGQKDQRVFLNSLKVRNMNVLKFQY